MWAKSPHRISVDRSVFAFALCVVAGWSPASSRGQTALPNDISIATPASTVTPDAAAFSGAWLGVWGGEIPTALVVEQIHSNGAARVIYSWGDLPGHFKTGWSRETARILSGKLEFQTTGGAKAEFSLEPGRSLYARYQLSNEPPAFAELQRLPTTDPPAILEAAKKPVVDWEEVRIPVQSQVGPTRGKTFGLQTTIYRQASAGRHPVIISNHGSTGPGIIPVKDVYRGGNEEIFYHSLGYVVVVPMRKGRGLSEGPYVEEDDSVSPAIQLDSAIEDLQAVVQYVRHRDDVDPKRIIVEGVSRGGLLSVAYAGRYPTNVAGVINFSGGWFGEWHPEADFNFETFAKSGHDARVPMLWLYADGDSFYSLKFVESEFSKFREAGGRGELVKVRDISGEGHLLCLWVDHWQDKVTGYLNSCWSP